MSEFKNRPLEEDVNWKAPEEESNPNKLLMETVDKMRAAEKIGEDEKMIVDNWEMVQDILRQEGTRIGLLQREREGLYQVDFKSGNRVQSIIYAPVNKEQHEELESYYRYGHSRESVIRGRKIRDSIKLRHRYQKQR